MLYYTCNINTKKESETYMKKILSFIGLLGMLALLGVQQVHADETYTIQSGDSLTTILQNKYGNLDNLFKVAKDNHIDNIHLIYTGDKLNLKDNYNDITLSSTELASYKIQLSQIEMEQVYQETVQNSVQEPVQQPVQESTEAEVPQTTTTVEQPVTTSGAKEWIANKESGGSYTAVSPSGQHYGKYQLMYGYLNGDLSPENQERVADAYVQSRYGSWENAKAFWLNNGWY